MKLQELLGWRGIYLSNSQLLSSKFVLLLSLSQADKATLQIV